MPAGSGHTGTIRHQNEYTKHQGLPATTTTDFTHTPPLERVPAPGEPSQLEPCPRQQTRHPSFLQTRPILPPQVKGQGQGQVHRSPLAFSPVPSDRWHSSVQLPQRAGAWLCLGPEAPPEWSCKHNLELHLIYTSISWWHCHKALTIEWDPVTEHTGGWGSRFQKLTLFQCEMKTWWFKNKKKFLISCGMFAC